MTDTEQDHHGGGLWAFENDDPESGEPFMLRNLAGIEWSAQFCADPKKVDLLRKNAVRFYAMFPRSVAKLGIRDLLDTPIVDAPGVARWTDSICNASVPLPASMHTGVLPKSAGIHHYPTPVAEIALFKYDDFILWVTDQHGNPTAVAPIAPRGSGISDVQVLYSTPGTPLAEAHAAKMQYGGPLVLPAHDSLSQQAFRLQQHPNA